MDVFSVEIVFIPLMMVAIIGVLAACKKGVK